MVEDGITSSQVSAETTTTAGTIKDSSVTLGNTSIPLFTEYALCSSSDESYDSDECNEKVEDDKKDKQVEYECKSILSRKRRANSEDDDEIDGYDEENGAEASPNAKFHRRHSKRVRFSDGSIPGQPLDDKLSSPIGVSLLVTVFDDKSSSRPLNVATAAQSDQEDLLQTHSALQKNDYGEESPGLFLEHSVPDILSESIRYEMNHKYGDGEENDKDDFSVNGVASGDNLAKEGADEHESHGSANYGDGGNDDDEAALEEFDRLVAGAGENEFTRSNEFVDVGHGLGEEDDIQLAVLTDEREQLLQQHMQQRVSHVRQRVSEASWDGGSVFPDKHSRLGEEDEYFGGTFGFNEPLDDEDTDIAETNVITLHP